MDKYFATMQDLPASSIVNAPASVCDPHSYMLALPEDYLLSEILCEYMMPYTNSKRWPCCKTRLKLLFCTLGVLMFLFSYGL